MDIDTIDLAVTALERTGREYGREFSVQNHGDGHRVILVAGTGPDKMLRIWSEDREAHLAIALADKWGSPTGEKLEVHSTSPMLIAGAIAAALALV